MNHDEALIKQALQGDREAFGALVEAYWPVAERVAHGILKDAHLAEDVSQDVFADIYVQRARYQERFSFRAYVAAIARHKSIDLLRRRGHPVPFDAAWADGAQTPESAFIESMFRGALHTAVEKLPDRQRRMLKAYALEKQSYRDIAAAHGVTVAQVKIALHRVRKSLRRVREDWDA